VQKAEWWWSFDGSNSLKYVMGESVLKLSVPISTSTGWLKAWQYISRLPDKLAIVLAAINTKLVHTDKIKPAYHLSRDQCLSRKVQDLRFFFLLGWNWICYLRGNSAYLAAYWTTFTSFQPFINTTEVKMVRASCHDFRIFWSVLCNMTIQKLLTEGNKKILTS
jgi:hypothetical protein